MRSQAAGKTTCEQRVRASRSHEGSHLIDNQRVQRDPKPAGRAPTAAQHHILVVDDDPAVIQRMDRIIAKIAHVQLATSGASALTLLVKSRPDLVLLDADMPGMSGFETCRPVESALAAQLSGARGSQPHADGEAS
jgi:PleD family two-component response regulator